MKHIRPATCLLIILWMGFPRLASADILPVLPGGSVQAQIDLAQPGDTVAIFGGTYAEDITVSNAVRLAEVSGQEVTLAGNVTITGVTNAPPLEGFTIASSGRALRITDCPGILLKDLTILGFGLYLFGTTEAQIQDCEMTELRANSTRLEMSDSTVTGDMWQYGSVAQIASTHFAKHMWQHAGFLYLFDVTVDNYVESLLPSEKLVIFRSEISESVYCHAPETLIGYSSARRIVVTSGGDATLVGNVIDTRGLEAPNYSGILILDGNHHLVVANNRVISAHHGIVTKSGQAGDVDGFIVNNYFECSRGGNFYGINVEAAAQDSDIQVINNIVKVVGSNGIYAHFGTVVKGNFAPSVNGGAVATETSTANPMYDWATNTLLPGSPAIDGGSTDARYRDRDGSRNDAGPTGGAWFDPDGWTTDNPVVFSFDLSPEQVLEGTATDIILSNGQAVNQP